MSTRILQSKGLLNDATAIIHSALGMLNASTQAISSESAPDLISDYQAKHGADVVVNVSGDGNNVFYSGFETTDICAGSGNDTFHFYLGDSTMKIKSGAGRDQLIIHADANEYAKLGLNTNIQLCDLFYEDSTNTLIIQKNNLLYARMVFSDWDCNDDISLLLKDGQYLKVILSDLKPPSMSNSASQHWSPIISSDPVKSNLEFDLKTLSNQLHAALAVNTAVL